MTRANSQSGKSGHRGSAPNPLASRRRASARAMSLLQFAFGGLPSKADCDGVYDQAFVASEREFDATYLAAEVFSKFDPEDTATKQSRQKAAVSSFFEGEALCHATNRRLVWDPYGTQNVARVIRISQRLIADVLGDFDLEEFVLLCGHGSGATCDLARAKSSPQQKWTVDETLTVTSAALPYAIAFSQWFPNHWEELPGRNNGQFRVVMGDVLDSVNKDMVRNRVIGKGPTMNIFFQKGLGKCHRRRLQRVGLLHKDAQQHHQQLAKQGSLTGYLATVDLKNASSTIAYALVELLYAHAGDWLTHMKALRADWWEWNKEHRRDRPTGRYEMFSAMGNGFTFEMETLMFWALTKATCLVLGVPSSVKEVSVYGDDIICPANAVDLLREVFTHCGLTFNAKKSHWVGRFRESCGGHYYAGRNVTPFYLKKPLRTIVDLINLHNKVSLWLANGQREEPHLEAVLRACRSAVPKKHWGPPGLAGTLWSPWHLNGAVWNRNRQAWCVEALRYETTRQATSQHGGNRYWQWERRFGGGEDVGDELRTSELPVVDKGRVIATRLYFDSQRYSIRDHWAFLAPVYVLS